MKNIRFFLSDDVVLLQLKSQYRLLLSQIRRTKFIRDLYLEDSIKYRFYQERLYTLEIQKNYQLNDINYYKRRVFGKCSRYGRRLKQTKFFHNETFVKCSNNKKTA